MNRREEIEQAAIAAIKGDDFEDGCIGKAYFKIGAEWADRTMIDRVCNWLEENLAKELSIIYSGCVNINTTNVIKELRKAMEE